MPLEPSRELVLKKLRQFFTNDAAATTALALLNGYPGDTEQGQARIQLAILKQCDHDLRRLLQLVKLAHTDYRDVLVGAGSIKGVGSLDPLEFACPTK